jgi:hypothetical protein
VRDGGGDLVDLALDRVVVERIERRVQGIDQEQPDDRMRRHQIDLEFRARGNFAGVFQPPEVGVGRLRNIRIKQIVETHVLGAKSRYQRVALAPGAAGVDTEKLTGFHKGRIIGERRFEPGDPVAALAGFAVRQPLDSRAKGSAHGLKHFGRVREGNAADQMNVHRGYSAACNDGGRMVSTPSAAVAEIVVRTM